MDTSHVGALVQRIADAVPAEMDRGEVNAFLGDLKRLRSWVAACEIAGSRRIRSLNAEGHAENPESALRNKGGHSDREARDAADREETADALPGFESALAEGDVTPGHLDALAAARKLLAHEPGLLDAFAGHETELLGSASSDSVETFRRRCRGLAKRLIADADNRAPEKELERQRQRSKVRQWRDKATGMHHFHLEVDPIRGSTVDRHLHAELMRLRSDEQNTSGDPTPYMQLLVEAFFTAITHTGDGGPQVPEVIVHIDLDTLNDSIVEAGLCETDDGIPIPAETVRRLACDAQILPAMMDGGSLIRDMGRATRTATPAQKRQLSTMHATCGEKDCQVPFHKCRIHHVRFWTRDRGVTDIINLVPLCDTHHHLVHECGWKLLMTPDRVATWIMPDGTIYHQGPCTDRQPDTAEVAA